jgi:hypothetical protein
MRIPINKTIFPIVIGLMVGCASESAKYDLPSAGTRETPKWVDTHITVRDSIFIVIHLPEADSQDMELSIQKAQSELHTLLMNEIEVILRDYWDEKELKYTDDDKFQLLSGLPLTLEQIMSHVEVTDGWEKNGEYSILCALDYEAVAADLIEDMEIEDKSFLPYLKRRMDDLALRHR